jgi:signal transduction histidine kinase
VQRALATGQPQEAEVHAPSGNVWHVRGSLIRDREGRVVGVVDVALNVSERRRALEAWQRRVEREKRLAAAAALADAERARAEELRRACEELRQTQDRLVQASKLAAIGRFVAGIAHEMNSPLCVVQGCASLLLEDLAALPAELRAALPGFEPRAARIAAAAQRCKAIIDDLLAFARQSVDPMEDVDLASIARGVLELPPPELSAGVRVVLALEPARMRGSGAKLRQVVSNLVTNALQALPPSGGELVVKTGQERGGAVLEVRDDGCGIPPAIRDRIFDPFFTTKQPGQGTGLGLSIVHTVVEQHGGHISLESTSSGTTFRILFPSRSDEQPT